MNKKIYYALLALFFWGFGCFFYKEYKATNAETFTSFLVKSKFYKKLNEHIPNWVQEQIANDFDEKRIQQKNIDYTYREIQKHLYNNDMLSHYRILDNKLYKYVDDQYSFVEKDNNLEKALKTLLLIQKVPDVDFLLSIVDGIEEPYMPKNCFSVKDVSKQVPILGQAKESTYKNIVLVPDQFSLSDKWANISNEVIDINKTSIFEEKIEKAFWRGSLTDMGLPNECFPFEGYKSCPRFKICKCDSEYVDAGIVFPLLTKYGEEILKKENVIKQKASNKEHIAYKYLPVLDGHMCTYPGYQWRLLSNSVALKQESNQIQWFYNALKPFEHYIPIENDMSDLCEKIKWAKENNEKVKIIINNAQDFVLNNLLFEDNYVYLFRILYNYSRLQDIDFNIMKKTISKDKNWVCIQSRFRLKMKKQITRLIKSLKGEKYGS